jgi:hypothetical protein
MATTFSGDCWSRSVALIAPSRLHAPRLIPGDVVQLMLQEKAYGKDLEDLREAR